MRDVINVSYAQGGMSYLFPLRCRCREGGKGGLYVLEVNKRD